MNRRRTRSSSPPIKKRWGADKITHFVSEPAYFQVHLFKQAVEKLGGKRYHAADDPRSRHGTRSTRRREGTGEDRAGKLAHLSLAEDRPGAGRTASSRSSKQSKEWVKPLPYWAYPDQVCTPNGLVEKKT